jgi:hypothetical protein
MNPRHQQAPAAVPARPVAVDSIAASATLIPG